MELSPTQSCGSVRASSSQPCGNGDLLVNVYAHTRGDFRFFAKKVGSFPRRDLSPRSDLTQSI